MSETPVLLELFSGMGAISHAFEVLGGKAYRVDWSPSVDADLHADVAGLSISDVLDLCGGVPSSVWASPQCTTYSTAANGRHRTIDEWLQPKTDLARADDRVNRALWRLTDGLTALGTRHYFVENPVGTMRRMDFVARRPRWTVTYCTYGSRGNAAGHEHEFILKPTDIWTDHPNPQFLPRCPVANPPHVHGDWGVARKRDYLSRGEMPEQLVGHLASLLIGRRVVVPGILATLFDEVCG